MGKLITRQTSVQERREIAKAIYNRVLAGERVTDIAEEVGEHFTAVYRMIKLVGPVPRRKPTRKNPHVPQPMSERNIKIARTYLYSSATMPQLAERHGMTKQNVKHIIDRYLQEYPDPRLGRTQRQRSLAVASNEQNA